MKTIEEQMSVYAAYHRHPMNKAIHFVFVPLIIWSTMGLLTLVRPPWSIGGLQITAALIVSTVLLIYYLRLDFALGVAMTVLFTVGLVAAHAVATEADGTVGDRAWLTFLLIFAFSWVAQIVGHKYFEHRKPALVDNVFQVFVAPIFVVAEWAFALGLKKELHEKVEQGMVAHLPAAQTT